MPGSQQSRANKTAHILKYLQTDLLCFRAASPKKLAELQHEKWQPWLDWFENQYGEALQITTGIVAITHSSELHKTLEKEINSQTDQAFEALYGAITVCGSFVLGLAITKQKLSPQAALELIFLEEKYKDSLYDAEKYGTDPHIEKKQKEALLGLKHAYALARESTKKATASNA